MESQTAMSVMIKLQLSEDERDFNPVQALGGLDGIQLDADFGLVLIDPRKSLYVVRAAEIDNVDARKKISPQIIDAYGDVRISSARD